MHYTGRRTNCRKSRAALLAHPEKKVAARESKSCIVHFRKRKRENDERGELDLTGSAELLAEIQELGHVLDGDVALDGPEVIVQGDGHCHDFLGSVFW